MTIEIWSDIACPFCYIGKKHLEKALDSFPHKGAVEIEWKSFELDPEADLNADGALSMDALLASKYGISRQEARAMNERVEAMAADAGITYDLSRAVPTNTFNAHRLSHLAKSHGLQGEAEERLMSAYLTEGRHIGDLKTLGALMQEIGIGPVETQRVLSSDEFGYEVRTDQQEARSLGVRGVPFFVFDRSYAISGAQPVELFAETLERAWAESRPLQVTGEGATCDENGCAI